MAHTKIKPQRREATASCQKTQSDGQLYPGTERLSGSLLGDPWTDPLNKFQEHIRWHPQEALEITMSLSHKLAHECIILAQQRAALSVNFLFSNHQGEKQHVVLLTHHTEHHLQILNVELLHPCWHPCKRHSSDEVDAVYMNTIQRYGTWHISVISWAVDGRQLVLSGDCRPIKGHRSSIWRLLPDDSPTFSRLWVAHSHMKSADCWLIVAR